MGTGGKRAVVLREKRKEERSTKRKLVSFKNKKEEGDLVEL